MNPTIKLLRVIGSPFLASKREPINKMQAEELYEYAVKNRIPHLYLETLKENEMTGKLRILRDRLHVKYLNLIDAVGRISCVLINSGVEHAIFKTVRPYLAATADIDVLIVDDKYAQTLNLLRQKDYEFLGSGPESTTFHDDQSDIKIDVYREVAISHVVYLDKLKIKKSLTQANTPDGQPFYTLTREADLMAVIAHSVIKEQMYSLGEYYTVLYYLLEMSKDEIGNFVGLVRENRVTRATRSSFTLTATLHRRAHSAVPRVCKELLEEFGSDSLEEAKLSRNSFQTPHKYHILTALKALQEESKEERIRRSIATQILSMLRPSFAGFMARETARHIRRESY